MAGDPRTADLRFALGEGALGAVLVARSGLGVRAVLLGDDPDALVRDLRARFPLAGATRDDAGLAPLLATVVAHVEAPATPVDLPIDPTGTDFQRRVWGALRGIPPGRTATYGEVARRIGAPAAARAVAAACGANALAVVVPCHRVVRGDGALSGYRWGVHRKRALLEREAAATPPRPP